MPQSKRARKTAGLVHPLASCRLPPAASAKVFYVFDTQEHVGRSYMVVLACATREKYLDNLRTRGVIEIPHFRSAALYEELMGRASKRRQRNITSFDDDDGAALFADFERAAVRHGGPGFRLEEYFLWRCIIFKGLKATKTRAGGWQADCPRKSHATYRRRPDGSLSKTSCSWSLTYVDETDREDVKRKLMWWACKSHDFVTKRAHKASGNEIQLADIPENVDENKIPSDLEATDVEEPVAMPRGGRGRGRGRGRVRARGRAAVVPGPEVKPGSGGSGDGEGDESSDDSSSDDSESDDEHSLE